MVTYAAGETREPSKTIPRALLIGVLLVTVCYVALNAAYLYLLPLDKVIASTRVAADAASTMAGPRAAASISGLVILSSLGVLNGVILAGPRMYYAMAQEGLAFPWLGRIHPRFHTPHIAIAFQALWSSFLVATGTYRELFTRVVYTEWLFFALMAVGLLRLRGRKNPLIPLLFIVASIAVALIQISANPRQAASGIILVLLGLPVYFFWTRKNQPGILANNANH